jgi:hypothetical protein
MKNKQHIMVFDIPSGMCRSVEWNGGTSSLASRQGCIPIWMQERGVCAFSTERCIPNGIRLQKFKTVIGFLFSIQE